MDAMPAVRLNTDLFDQRCQELDITSEIDKAKLGGVDTSTLWRFRKGEIGPRLEVARRFARALDVSTDDLWPDAA